MRGRQRSTTADRRRELFDEAVRFVERESRRGLSLDDAARQLATSRRQLQRILAEVGDTSFRELVLSARMRHARHLLDKSAATVREIARAVGYTEAADFSKAFQRYHGMTPSQYRKRGTRETQPERR